MQEQHFSHENELLAMAPLNADGDNQLFKKQRVHLTDAGYVQWDFILPDAGYVQWDFILPDGIDWHFHQESIYLRSDIQLKEFKEFIRDELRQIIARRIEQAR
ncbi:hypothetical protein ACN5FX_10480 [Klebsiella pneumoniae]|uniref:hypothetical protein n=1 Tax=Klebsiella pneumoniae TaxID=573 RepID=UPI003AF847AF